MRKLLMVVAVVFASSLFTTVGVEAAKVPTGKRLVSKCVKPKAKRVLRVTRHKAMPARYARGPIINVPKSPAPIVNVPEQPAPVVNVPQQPAPIVNVAAPLPTVGVTVDSTMIYIVRGSQLMVLDKCTYEVKKTMSLD